jgi:hypothetical protein
MVRNVVRYPDQGLAIALLCNLENIGSRVGGLTEHVADAFLANAFTQPPPRKPAPPSHISLSSVQLANKVGWYRDAITGDFSRIFLQGGRLRVAPSVTAEATSFELTPVGENRFVIEGTPVEAEFTTTPAGIGQEIHVTGAGSKPSVAVRIKETAAPSNDELRALTGRYASDDLGETYTVAPAEQGLVLEIPGRPRVPLRPIVANAFGAGPFGVVEFLHSRRGSVIGFNAHVGGVRDLRFVRAQ